MKDFVLINFQDNLCEAIPRRPMPCMPVYRPTRSSADCFIIIKLFVDTLAMIQTSVMSVITLHLCTLFNQPRHHFAALSSETRKIYFWGIQKDFGHFSVFLGGSEVKTFCDLLQRRCTRVSFFSARGLFKI